MNRWIVQSALGRYLRDLKAKKATELAFTREMLPGTWLKRPLTARAQWPALMLSGIRLSYQELAERVELAASRLQRLSNAPVFGVCTSDPYLILICQHLAARLGRAMLALDIRMPEVQRNSLIQQSGCRLVLGDDSVALPEDVRFVPGSELLAVRQADDKPLKILELKASDPARILLIVPTSGTNSAPKGVMLSAMNLAASAAQVNVQLGLKARDCWLNCLPLSHVAGLSIAYRCSQVGAAMLLHERFDPARIWRDLEQQKVTHISLVPAMLGRLLDAARGRVAPASLRVALIGGGPLDPTLARRAHAAGWPLKVSYGMTETGSMCVLDATAQSGLKPGRVGQPVFGFQVDLSDAEQGMIRVSGRAVMAGYVNPELKPGDGLREGSFITGDLGYWDDQGQLCVTGRADDLMNSGGLRLHPREVEQLMGDCPRLASVAVSSRADPLWGDLLVALYEGDVSESWLEEWARSNLPSGLRPREFHRVDYLPRNRMGKLDRHALRRHISTIHSEAPQVDALAVGLQGSA